VNVKINKKAVIMSIYIFIVFFIGILLFNQDPVVILNEPIIGDVELNHTDSLNFIYLLQTKQKLNTSFLDFDTKNDTKLAGKILRTFNTKKFIISHGSTIKIDNQIFSCDYALYEMALQNIFSSAKLSELIANGEVTLEAKDINKGILIKSNDKTELVFSIKQASLSKDDSENITLATGIKFPDYHLKIIKGDQKLDIQVQNEKRFYFDRLMRMNLYNNGIDVWNYCNNKLPITLPNSDDIKYLLTAKTLNSPELGDLNHRILGIARLFSAEKPINDKIHKVLYTLIFSFENEKDAIVKVGNDKFEFNNLVFYLPEIGEQVLSAAMAG
jgi:hypothetical protein